MAATFFPLPSWPLSWEPESANSRFGKAFPGRTIGRWSGCVAYRGTRPTDSGRDPSRPWRSFFPLASSALARRSRASNSTRNTFVNERNEFSQLFVRVCVYSRYRCVWFILAIFVHNRVGWTNSGKGPGTFYSAQQLQMSRVVYRKLVEKVRPGTWDCLWLALQA